VASTGPALVAIRSWPTRLMRTSATSPVSVLISREPVTAPGCQ
jgi:hypothetical protein